MSGDADPGPQLGSPSPQPAGSVEMADRRIASFHLVRLHPRRHVQAMARLGLDRLRLRRTPGLVFFRLLGTGAGRETGPGADLRRTAMFAIWENEAALDRYLAANASRWAAAEEAFHVRLLGLGGHGSWRGRDVLAMIAAVPADHSGPVAIITRAEVRIRHWRRFAAAGRPVSKALEEAPGLLAVCGIGEAPLGRQATFSLWADIESARAYAYATPEHRQVIERTRAEGWYGEEMFARFAPYGSTGTWDGRDWARAPIGRSIP